MGRGVGRGLRWAHRLRARARETEVRAHRAGDTTRPETVETADAPTARQKGAMCPAPRNGRVIHLHRVLTVQHPKRKPNTKVSGRESGGVSPVCGHTGVTLTGLWTSRRVRERKVTSVRFNG